MKNNIFFLKIYPITVVYKCVCMYIFTKNYSKQTYVFNFSIYVKESKHEMNNINIVFFIESH